MRKRSETAPRSRLSRLRSALKKSGPPALLVSHLPNVRYLTGFTGSAGTLLVDSREAVFLTDFRYRLQAAREVRGCRLVEYSGGLLQAVVREVRKKRTKTLGFDAAHLSHQAYRDLTRGLSGVKLSAASGIVEGFRMVKDAAEVSLLRRAVRASAGAYRIAAHRLAGMAEEKVAAGLEAALRRSGAEWASFSPIVASGPRGALPHASPSPRRIRGGDLVILDFGARFQGYHADITRTRLPGRGGVRRRRLYRLVFEAQRRAIAAVRPGVRASEVDAAAREVIAAAGYGNHFGHGTGHGVGLEVHEGPYLSSRSREVLAPGMVVTVEPGVYLKNFGGVRIEDMVLVTESGCEVLSRGVPKLVL